MYVRVCVLTDRTKRHDCALGISGSSTREGPPVTRVFNAERRRLSVTGALRGPSIYGSCACDVFLSSPGTVDMTPGKKEQHTL